MTFIVTFIDKMNPAGRKAPFLASKSGTSRIEKRHFSHRKAPLYLYWFYI